MKFLGSIRHYVNWLKEILGRIRHGSHIGYKNYQLIKFSKFFLCSPKIPKLHQPQFYLKKDIAYIKYPSFCFNLHQITETIKLVKTYVRFVPKLEWYYNSYFQETLHR